MMYVFNYNIVNLPAVTVGIGMVIVVEVTIDVVAICDIVVINILSVVIGVLIVKEVTRLVVGVYDIIVVNFPEVTVEIGDIFVVSPVIREVVGVKPKG